MTTHVYIDSDKTLAMGPNGMVALTTDAMGSKTLHPVYDLRGKRCYLCQKFWELTAEDYLDHIHHKNGLELHRSCHRRHQTLNVNRDWDQLVQDNNIPYRGSELVSNPYSSEMPDRIRYDLGHVWGLKLLVGCRKNVNEIRFYGMPHDLFWLVARSFEDWEHTKGYSMDDPGPGPYVYVHTWTRDDINAVLDLWRRCVISHEKEAQLPVTEFDERRGWRTFGSLAAHIEKIDEQRRERDEQRRQQDIDSVKQVETAIKEAVKD